MTATIVPAARNGAAAAAVRGGAASRRAAPLRRLDAAALLLVLSLMATGLAAPDSAGSDNTAAGGGKHAPRAALTVRIVVAQPADFDARLQAAFASGVLSQLEAAQNRTAWIAAASHRSVRGVRRRVGAASAAFAKNATTTATEYALTAVVEAATRREANAARDGVLAAVNRGGAGGGICGLRADGGGSLAGVCEAAADYAEIDRFDPQRALVVARSRASRTAAPAGGGAPPRCRAEGEACDGAAARCCSWAAATCDLRPGSRTEGTCTSLTGARGANTCKKQDTPCGRDDECCSFLKCAATSGDGGNGSGNGGGGDSSSGGAAVARRCTFTPEYGALRVNVTVAAGTPYDADAQHGLLSALRQWLLHEGAGAGSARVAGYAPLRRPAEAEWAADPTYRYELVVGAATRPALDSALQAARAALHAPAARGGRGGRHRGSSSSGSGSRGGGGEGLCALRVSSYGPRDSVCTIARQRCEDDRATRAAQRAAAIQEDAKMWRVGHASASDSSSSSSSNATNATSASEAAALAAAAAALPAALLEPPGPQAPCGVQIAAAAVEAVAGVAADYKNATCRAEGEACGGPFGVAGACCGGRMCVRGGAGADPALLTGVCRAKCAAALEPCTGDAQCCSHWGPLKCSARLGMCVRPEWNLDSHFDAGASANETTPVISKNDNSNLTSSSSSNSTGN